MNRLLVFFVLTYITSCASSSTSTSSQGEGEYKEVATKALGDNVEYKLNDSKTFVLCVNEVSGTVKQPRNSLSYLVINLKDNSISLENKVDGGTVSWYKDNLLQVYLTPGTMRDDQTRDDFITLYNVETGKSFPKNKSETH